MPCNCNICDITKETFVCQMLKLLPRGKAWQGEVMNSYFKSFFECAYDILPDMCCLIKESFPCESDKLLFEWAEVFGVPEKCNDGCTTTECLPDSVSAVPIEENIKQQLCLKLLLQASRCCNAKFIQQLGDAFELDIEVLEPPKLSEMTICSRIHPTEIKETFYQGCDGSVTSERCCVTPVLLNITPRNPVIIADICDMKIGQKFCTVLGLDAFKCLFEKIKPAHVQFNYCLNI